MLNLMKRIFINYKLSIGHGGQIFNFKKIDEGNKLKIKDVKEATLGDEKYCMLIHIQKFWVDKARRSKK